MLTLGFVGFGEAGYNLSADFPRDKVCSFAYDTEGFADTPRGELIRAHAAENGVELVGSLRELTERAEVFFCFTSPRSALPIAQQIAPLLKKGQIYADMNSTSPQTKRDIAKVFADSSQGDFVEAAVMSSLPTNRTRVPIKLCGERAAELADRLDGIGMNAVFLDTEIGKASAVKMLKSILAKGIIAVVTETIFCTEQYGVTDMVLNGEKSFLEELGFLEYCSHDVTQAATHNRRFALEMEEVLDTIDSMGENGIMTKAAIEKFRWLDQSGFGAYFPARPETYHEVIEAKKILLDQNKK